MGNTQPTVLFNELGNKLKEEQQTQLEHKSDAYKIVKFPKNSFETFDLTMGNIRLLQKIYHVETANRGNRYPGEALFNVGEFSDAIIQEKTPNNPSNNPE